MGFGLQKILAGLILLVVISLLILSPKPASATLPQNSPFPLANNNFITAAQNQQYVITSPVCPDADNDGICDSWEKNTPDANGFTGLDVEYDQNGQHYSYKWPCDPNATYATDALGTTVCPNPYHKDIYVEVDWMTTQGPNLGVLAAVVSAFVNSPTNNPLDSGKTGINLHIQNGETPTSGDMNFFYNPLKVSSATWTTRPGFFVLKENYFGTFAERSGTDPNNQGVSAINLLMAKRQAFHYAMFIHNQQEAGYTTSSGWAEILGNDLVVSLGSFYNGVGSIDDQEGSFMHELGHNMGLYHGGGYPSDITHPDNDNCKPNYLSVMSYTYQFASSFDANRPLDFSNKQLNTLDESNLNEQAGVNSYPYPSGAQRPIFFSGPTGLLLPPGHTGVPVDWNGNGVYTNSGYSQILNSLPSKSACQNTVIHPLCGHDDWNNDNAVCVNQNVLVLTFQQSSNSATGNGTSLNQGHIPDYRAYNVPCKIIPLARNDMVYHKMTASFNYPSTTAQTTIDQYGSESTTNQGSSYNNTVVTHPYINNINATNQGLIYNKAVVTNPYNNNVGTNNTVATTPCGETTEATWDQVSSFRALHITLINNTLFAFPPKVFSSDSALQTLATDVNNANLTQGDVWATYYQLGVLKNDSQKLIVNEDAQKTIGQEIDDTKALYATAGTVPEFGPVAVIILGISFVSIIIISRTRINLKF